MQIDTEWSDDDEDDGAADVVHLDAPMPMWDGINADLGDMKAVPLRDRDRNRIGRNIIVASERSCGVEKGGM